ncbi:hypothetical protein B0H12DRAFT_1076871 [Mycena haematopus]|nr:hypothetical protein B0H12DRAFT_1076871 [Mycena haematopus]
MLRTRSAVLAVAGAGAWLLVGARPHVRASGAMLVGALSPLPVELPLRLLTRALPGLVLPQSWRSWWGLAIAFVLAVDTYASVVGVGMKGAAGDEHHGNVRATGKKDKQERISRPNRQFSSMRKLIQSKTMSSDEYPTSKYRRRNASPSRREGADARRRQTRTSGAYPKVKRARVRRRVQSKRRTPRTA